MPHFSGHRRRRTYKQCSARPELRVYVSWLSMVSWVPSNEVSHLSTFQKYVGVGTALGIVFGAVFGQEIFGDVGVAVAMGMFSGTAIGAALGRAPR